MPDRESEPPDNVLPSLDTFDPEAEEPVKEFEEMTFLEHLEDLRWTLMKSLIAFGLACVIVGIFLTAFSDMLRWPYDFAVADRETLFPGLVSTSILGVFSVIFYLLLGGGLALSLPFILYFIGQFVAPGLNQKELKMLKPACAAAMLLFVVGAVFSFFVLLPAALRASMIFNEMLGFTPMWNADSYYSMLTWMVLGVGLTFQFPLALLILVYLQVLSHTQLVAFRRYSMVLFLCLAAVVTPTTDPVTFLLLAAPMSVLYEISILGARRIEKKRPAISL